VIDPLRRFERQMRFEPLGRAGQERLGRASVLLVGCGALGGALAQSMVRSGVGRLVLVDRDYVELSNLPRQVLFDERHAHDGALKVEAAAESLKRIGGPTRVEVHAAHLDAGNLAGFARGVDLILDGTDNLTTRYLLNDYALEARVPWIYGGVVAAHGLVLAVLPGRGPCLRCLFPEPAPQGALPTCDTAGVVQPAVAAVAAYQAAAALRLLSGGAGFVPRLLELDLWEGTARGLELRADPECPACARGERRFLREAPEQRAVLLCGRATVQVRGTGERADLARLAHALQGVARNVRHDANCLRFEAEARRFTVFGDGRALIEGTDDLGQALALYDRFVGT